MTEDIARDWIHRTNVSGGCWRACHWEERRGR